MTKDKSVLKCQLSRMKPNNGAVKAAQCKMSSLQWNLLQHGRSCELVTWQGAQFMEVVIRTSERPVPQQGTCCSYVNSGTLNKKAARQAE